MPVISSRRLRGDRGFSMFIVIMAMLLTTMFIAAAFAAANNDLPLSGNNRDRNAALSAAESGLNYYETHLVQDPDYWTKCTSVPPPNAGEPSPVNQQWDGTGTDPRVWRTIPGSTAQYTIEILHTKSYTACDPTKQDSVIDLATGTFKIRVTGRPRVNSTVKRSMIITFQRASFLNFVYFTNFEETDPMANAKSADQQAYQTSCGDKYRSARPSPAMRSPYTGCEEIQFASGDSINGPAHTNDDSLLICGTPTFGRKVSGQPNTDVVEVAGGGTGHVANGSSCSDSPTINTPTGKFTTNAPKLDLPQTNSSLQAVAASDGTVYSGKTIIRLNGTTMTVTNYSASGTPTTSPSVQWPDNGVVYVANNGTCTSDPPTAAAYNDTATCGDVYVSGTYSKPLTIAAANDVIIRPTNGGKLDTGSSDANIIQDSSTNATLGLIANNFVRVAHMVDRSSGSCNVNTANDPVVTNVSIDAAILSLQHSFIVDNYDCGKLGTLTVNGAIAQKYRGPVGTGSGSTPVTGFTKNYWYDDRFRYRSPPYFLAPLDAAWTIQTMHEQVPAT